MNLIIDVGNTRTKLAVFKQDSLEIQVVCNLDQVIEEIVKLKKDYHLEQGIISSVVHLDDNFLKELNKQVPIISLTEKTKVPFYNLYKSKDTLGIDRIALVAAASTLYSNQNCLIIDAGTCITYDFLNSNNQYLGGAISPGLRIRYKSLSDYTDKLPLLNIADDYNLIGNSTKNSIHSGILNGIVNEIEGVINQYKSQFGHLTVVLTGGDSKFLAKQLKNSIFANQNFLLAGLNTILNFNN